MVATKTAFFLVSDDATITADGSTATTATVSNATKVSLYVSATLGGTTPSLDAWVQCADADGNWWDLGSGAGAITATGTTSEVGITGPFPGTKFRVRYDVDVASGNETYTAVDATLAFEYADAATIG